MHDGAWSVREVLLGAAALPVWYAFSVESVRPYASVWVTFFGLAAATGVTTLLFRSPKKAIPYCAFGVAVMAMIVYRIAYWSFLQQ